jgi:alkylation response protein AidB-like acyl-CoA dehydrogenase
VIQARQETDTGTTPEIWKKVVDMGWAGILVPEEYGGTEGTFTSAGVLFEALGTGPLPGPLFSSGVLSTLIVLEAGDEGQKKRLLPALADGGEVLALALTEPDHSWEPGGVSIRAKRAGGDFVLEGTKLFVLEAGAATRLVVAARTRSGADPSKGISLFLVDPRAEGVSIRRIGGFLAGRSFEVKLDSVRVPGSDLLGAAAQGWAALARAFEKAIPVLCAYKVGGSQAVFEAALEYTRTRVQFGMPIGRFQRVQDMIIEMVNHADAARWTTYEALWKLDARIPAAESVHLAKAVASTAYWEACTLAHQVFSGISYSKEHPASFHTRASRHLYGFLGDPSHHRQKLGRLLLR